MNHYDVQARELVNALFRKLETFLFSTGKGNHNIVEHVTSTTIYFKTLRSKERQRISRFKLYQVVAILLQRRSLTLRNIRINFNSAAFGLVKFIMMLRVKQQVTVKGELRLTLIGTRFVFAGCDRLVRDLEIAKENGAEIVLMSYYYLREQMKALEHASRLDLLVMLDSGEYTRYRARREGRRTKPIRLAEYADFVGRVRDTGVLHRYINLDRVGDPEKSRLHFEALTELVGEPPIPVWHVQSPLEELAAIVDNDHDLVAIGGGVFLSEPKRKDIFTRILNEFPHQLFHCLGLGSKLLYDLEFFSSDSTSWLAGRKYRRILTPEGQKRAPIHWSEDECVAHNVRELLTLGRIPG